jgi:sialidase-1
MEALPDPTCEGSMIDFRLRKKDHVLIFANLNHPSQRQNLTVRTNTDNGRSWTEGKLIEAGSTAYSDLVIDQHNHVGILYEQGDYTRIVYRSFRYKWLKE